MKLFFSFLMIIAAGMVAVSCRPSKKIQEAIGKKDTAAVVVVNPAVIDSARMTREAYEAIDKRRIRFNTFSAKIKVNYEDKEKETRDFNAFVRIQNDSVIWVSINAVLGIEAFRILITKDSVKLLNKLDKVVQLRSISYLQEITQLPFDFHTMQDLITGNPIYLDSNIISYRKNGEELSMLSVGDLFKHLITVNSDSYEVLHSKLDDLDTERNRTCDLTYGDYETSDARRFSTDRKITVSEKSRLDIKLNFKQYRFNEELTKDTTGQLLAACSL
jgi:Domain of unknown function (DUF4292)